MEIRNENTGKRKRKVMHRGAELVRSVKPGQSSAVSWQRESQPRPNVWKMNPAA